MEYLFTSESVSEGHPDKVADQISDAILDEYLKLDPESRVAVETMVTLNNVILAGEVRAPSHRYARINHEEVARDVIHDIGYTNPDLKFCADTVKVTDLIHGQSEEIAEGVDGGDSKEGEPEELGAGDQGMMFGYACREVEYLDNGIPILMPMPLVYAHRLVQELANIRKTGDKMNYLRPDSKSQVTIEYNPEGRIPQRIDTIVIATQHDPCVQKQEIKRDIRDHLLSPMIDKNLIDKNLIDEEFTLYVNEKTKFVEGGPHADAGLTGRKIIVDTYGGRGAHGGGAFSGKDPTKVDRSAAYAARHIAKNLVAAELADMVAVQLAYMIGEAKPVSIFIDSSGTAQKYGFSDQDLTEIVEKNFDMKPASIIENLKLRKAIYKETATYGHFGRSQFPWERLNMKEKLRAYAGI